MVRSLVSVLLASVSVSAPVWAQTETTASPREVGSPEIIVTAQRRSESVQKVPLTVNAFGQEMIQERRISDLTDLASQAPGLRFSEFANAGNVSLRGVGTAFVSGNGESSVSLYMDGVSIPQAKALGLAQFDIGGIEVLRGPQGTLYGRNSTGGVINFSSAAPTSEMSGGFTLGYGNYEAIRANAYVSGPITDRVRGRIFVEREHRNGYVRNVATGQDLNNLDAYGGRVSLDVDLMDTWTVKGRISTRVENSAGPVFDSFDPDFPILSAFGVPASVTAPDFHPYRVNSPLEYSGRRRFTLGSLINSIELSDSITLKSTTGFTNARFDNTYDTVGSALAFPLSALATSHSFSEELALNGSTTNIDWVLGAYYFRQRYTLLSLSNPPAGLGPNSRTDQTALQQSMSVFGDLTLRLGESTYVFGGARASREKVRQTLVISDLTPTGDIVRCPPPGVDADQSLRDDHVTGRLGVRHEVSDNVNLYVQAAHGYKAPSFSQSQCQNQYKPETVNAIEAGVKTRFLGGRGTFNVSAFFNDIKDLQLEVVSPLGVVVDNVPKAQIYGLEAALNIEPVTGFRVDANVSLLHARYTADYFGDANLSPTFTSQNVRGHRLNNAPDFSGFLGAEYELPVSASSSLTARGELVFTSKYNLREVDFPWTIQKGYLMQNAYLTYKMDDERLSLRGWIKNISNKAILGGVLGFGGVMGSFLPPRTYGVELIGKF